MAWRRATTFDIVSPGIVSVTGYHVTAKMRVCSVLIALV